ncbi:MAG: 4-hydroxy-tetrahydrodipicolinate reductase [Acutalibacteraceae bacterium]|nr:4-hydroxy-tetrahydrodipicolinate reductase [Acutalibacteraceae bacterium]
MKKIILNGCFGRMGKVITQLAEMSECTEICAGVDAFSTGNAVFSTYNNISDVKEKGDVIIDFSNPAALDGLLSFAISTKTPIVLATTGYSQSQLEQISNAAKIIPIFFTFNMSLGINLLTALCKKASQILGSDYDIEIIEKHHNQKLDAPSGTAIMLANAINNEFNDSLQYEYDRHSKRMARPKNEIGIHSVRGGTIVGEHEVIFAGNDEVISLSHSAASRDVFASGALRAATYVADKSAGLYDMNMLISD